MSMHQTLMSLSEMSFLPSIGPMFRPLRHYVRRNAQSQQHIDGGESSKPGDAKMWQVQRHPCPLLHYVYFVSRRLPLDTPVAACGLARGEAAQQPNDSDGSRMPPLIEATREESLVAGPAAEAEFLLYFTSGRLVAVVDCFVGALFVAGGAVQFLIASNYWGTGVANGVVAVLKICIGAAMWWVWRFHKKPWRRVDDDSVTIIDPTPPPKIVEEVMHNSVDETLHWLGSHPLDPHCPIRQHARRNAAFHERLVMLNAILNVVFGIINVAVSCQDTPGIEEEASGGDERSAPMSHFCLSTIQMQPLFLLAVLSIIIMSPLRAVWLVPLYAMLLSLYFSVRWLPDDVIPYGTTAAQFWSLAIVLSLEVFSCVAVSVVREIRARRRFEHHVERFHLCVQTERTRQKIEWMADAQVPLVFLRHSIEQAKRPFTGESGDGAYVPDMPFLFQEERGVVCALSIAGFGPWSSRRGPSDYVEVLQQVHDVYDHALRRVAQAFESPKDLISSFLQARSRQPLTRTADIDESRLLEAGGEDDEAGDWSRHELSGLLSTLRLYKVHTFGDVFLVIGCYIGSNSSLPPPLPPPLRSRRQAQEDGAEASSIILSSRDDRIHNTTEEGSNGSRTVPSAVGNNSFVSVELQRTQSGSLENCALLLPPSASHRSYGGPPAKQERSAHSTVSPRLASSQGPHPSSRSSTIAVHQDQYYEAQVEYLVQEFMSTALDSVTSAVVAAIGCLDWQPSQENAVAGVDALRPVGVVVDGNVGLTMHRTTKNVIGFGTAVEMAMHLVRSTTALSLSGGPGGVVGGEPSTKGYLVLRLTSSKLGHTLCERSGWHNCSSDRGGGMRGDSLTHQNLSISDVRGGASGSMRTGNRAAVEQHPQFGNTSDRPAVCSPFRVALRDGVPYVKNDGDVAWTSSRVFQISSSHRWANGASTAGGGLFEVVKKTQLSGWTIAATYRAPRLSKTPRQSFRPTPKSFVVFVVHQALADELSETKEEAPPTDDVRSMFASAMSSSSGLLAFANPPPPGAPEPEVENPVVAHAVRVAAETKDEVAPLREIPAVQESSTRQLLSSPLPSIPHVRHQHHPKQQQFWLPPPAVESSIHRRPGGGRWGPTTLHPAVGGTPQNPMSPIDQESGGTAVAGAVERAERRLALEWSCSELTYKFADPATESIYITAVTSWNSTTVDMTVSLVACSLSFIGLIGACFVDGTARNAFGANEDGTSATLLGEDMRERYIVRQPVFWSTVGIVVCWLPIACTMVCFPEHRRMFTKQLLATMSVTSNVQEEEAPCPSLSADVPHQSRDGTRHSNFPRVFNFASSVVAQLVYFLAIAMSYGDDSFVHQSQTLWIIVTFVWAAHRPLYPRVLLMSCRDALACGLFVLRAMYFTDEPSSVAEYFLYASIPLILIIRVFRERRRRVGFVLDMMFAFHQEELREDYRTLERVLEEMVPAGVSGKLVQRVREQHGLSSKLPQPSRGEVTSPASRPEISDEEESSDTESDEDDAFGPAARKTADVRWSAEGQVPQISRSISPRPVVRGRPPLGTTAPGRPPLPRRRRVHPLWSASANLEMDEVPFLFIQFHEAALFERDNHELAVGREHTQTKASHEVESMFCDERPPRARGVATWECCRERLSLLHRLHDVLALENRQEETVQLIQCTHDAALLVALPQGSGEDDQDECRALDLLRCANALMRMLSQHSAVGGNAAAPQGGAVAPRSCRVLLDVGAAMGAVFRSSSSVSFGYHGGVVHQAMDALVELPWGSCVGSRRFITLVQTHESFCLAARGRGDRCNRDEVAPMRILGVGVPRSIADVVHDACAEGGSDCVRNTNTHLQAQHVFRVSPIGYRLPRTYEAIVFAPS